MACTSTYVSDETDLVGQLYVYERRPLVHFVQRDNAGHRNKQCSRRANARAETFNRRLRAI
jgi:phage-related protein